MKAASLNELKTELKTLSSAELINLCLHLARYKKDNKELITYLLFEARDEAAYIRSVKELIAPEFEDMNINHSYFVRKTIRKILRILSKYIKFTGSPVTEVELLIYFCREMNDHAVPLKSHTSLMNLYNRQIQKIEKALATMHEDLQYDYREELESLKNIASNFNFAKKQWI